INSCGFYASRTSEAYKGFRKGRRWRMNSRDLVLIRQRAESVEHISPMLYGSRSENNTVRGMKSGTYSNMGVMTDFFKVSRMELIHGREINEMDVENRRKVCVLGREVYETLFEKDEDPLGQYIRLNGMFFQVVGVIRPLSEINVSSYPPRTVYIPFTTMQHTFMRGDYFWELVCTARKGYSASIVEEEVKSILRTAHDISPTDRTAVGSYNLEKEFLKFQGLFTGIDLLILFVGLGALLSGVIGISNIMLVTVRERMREIGVRRALGAKPYQILRQIMSESLLLTTLAGLLGFLAAVGILALVQSAMEINSEEGFSVFGPPLISFDLALGAMGILILSGAVAGLMPTLKALQIKAIDAIRD
ncbi:MAG: ABC transporter permease, partial [Rikenellaceae bacterium]|nr:ABC transporter permease [Rikenellaceae bacterium]